MFYQPLVKRILLTQQLTASEFRVLVLIMTFMNKDGSCYPSTTLLAFHLGVTPRAIQKELKKLAAKDYIKVIPRHRHSSTIELSPRMKTWFKDAGRDV